MPAATSETKYTATPRDALDVLYRPGDVVEMRIPNAPRNGTVSGYYNDFDALAHDAPRWSGKADGVYVTINPVVPALLARAANRLREYAKDTTTDKDILTRRWFPIDCDPVRPKGISSTDEEHDAAIGRARELAAWLRAQGWPEPVAADSGNGCHLLYAVDLPNDAGSTALVKRCLEALALRFSDERVSIDRTVYNAARVFKLYGTVAGKGDSTPDRPHRLARLLRVPPERVPVSLDLLAALAAQAAPEEPKRGGWDGTLGQATDRLDVAAWLAAHGLTVRSDGPWDDGHRWILDVCPWNPEHTDRSAYVVQFRSGAIAAGCHHDGCSGKDWYDLRDVAEPGWRERRQRTQGDAADEPETATTPEPRAWPDPPDPAAYYGLAGEIVQALEPGTEADPVGMLADILAAAGNIVGAGPHWAVSGSRHSLRLNVVKVGSTAKGRKGTGWASSRLVLDIAAHEWCTRRIASGLSSGEGLINAVRDPLVKSEPIKEKGRVVGYQDVIDDPGVEDKRLFVIEEEFASVLRVMGRDGNTLSALIRQAWDNGNLRTLTKNSPLQATGAHITIQGHITQDELLRYLDSTEAGNGFANRFIWLCVRRSKLLPDGGQLDMARITALGTRLAAVLATAPAAEMTRDATAAAMWRAIYGPLSEGRIGLLGAVLSRAEAQVMRLAAIYALLDGSTLIRGPHLEAALALWEYAERSAEYIFGDALGDPVADTILAALRQGGPMTRTDISGLFGRNQNRSRLDRALGTLLAAGKVRQWQDRETGGRATEWWAAQ